MLGLYIHIPFCRAKCNYCDFNSHIPLCGEVHRYIEALCREIEMFKGENKVDTVYFGGGTPTCVETRLTAAVLKKINECFDLDKNAEVTVECNPATVDERGLTDLRNAGFNRISIGVQSANDSELSELGRIHTAENAKECIMSARRAGFDNISADLMFGIPNQTFESFKRSIDFVTDCGTEHISCYALKIEEGTPFASMELNLPDEDESADMYDLCAEALKKRGFGRYEISNFAKAGFESRHNIKYWQCDDFAGFGAGAYSCVRGKRYSNIESTQNYITAVNSGVMPVAETVELSERDMMSEFMFLGLRLSRGISEAEFKNRFGRDLNDVFGEEVSINVKRGTLVRQDGRIWIPDKYIYVSNAVMADFV